MLRMTTHPSIEGATGVPDSAAPREAIRLLLGRERLALRAVDPGMTVLDWLRGETRRKGTKEGCNEGDCGACTVVIARPEGDGLTYRAVNSCIQFMGTLDGCQLLTVEDLEAPDGSLHPIQQAMVDHHGSQCGFCTPGFVMAMFALRKTRVDLPSEDAIDEGLAGNLCRCTGYAPIVRAMHAAYAGEAADRFDAEVAGTLGALHELEDGRDLVVETEGRVFHAPASIESLARTLLAHPDATLIAGSTDVGLWATKQFRRMDRIVSLGRVPGLATISETAEAVRIGAGVTYADAAPVLARHFPDFGELLRRLGSVQVRNMGTMGGNVANGSPIGDASPALIALGATLHLRQGAGCRSMPIERFFLAYGRQDRRPGEFLEAISVPKLPPEAKFRAYKVSKRFDQDISAVLGAFQLRLERGSVADSRLAFGGMAATPKRAGAAEELLKGRRWDETALRDAQDALAADFTPLTDMRATADYRMRIARNLLERLFIETAHGEPVETRLVGDRSLAHA